MENGLLFKELLQTPNFRITVVDDADTVELCGALKVKQPYYFCPRHWRYCNQSPSSALCSVGVLGAEQWIGSLVYHFLLRPSLSWTVIFPLNLRFAFICKSGRHCGVLLLGKLTTLTFGKQGVDFDLGISPGRESSINWYLFALHIILNLEEELGHCECATDGIDNVAGSF